MTFQTLQVTKKRKEKEVSNKLSAELERKIDSLTESLSKPYFNRILKALATGNLDNARTICSYILAEQTEINIKDSTKEGKIKILVWLSNHFKDEKAFKDMNKEGKALMHLLLSLRLYSVQILNSQKTKERK